MQDRSDREAHGVGQALGAERIQQVLHEAPDRAALVEDGAHQHTEGDEQAHIHHDVTETGGDGLDCFLDAEAGGEAQVHRTDDQGDDGIDSETDDQDDGGQNRHCRIDQYSYV